MPPVRQYPVNLTKFRRDLGLVVDEAKTAKLKPKQTRKLGKSLASMLEVWADNLSTALPESANVYAAAKQAGKEDDKKQSTVPRGTPRTQLLAAAYEIASNARITAALTRYSYQLRFRSAESLTVGEAQQLLDALKPPAEAMSLQGRRDRLAETFEAFLWSRTLPLDRKLDPAMPSVVSHGGTLSRDENRPPLWQLCDKDSAQAKMLEAAFAEPAARWLKHAGRKAKIPAGEEYFRTQYEIIDYFKDLRSAAVWMAVDTGDEEL